MDTLEAIALGLSGPTYFCPDICIIKIMSVANLYDNPCKHIQFKQITIKIGKRQQPTK